MIRRILASLLFLCTMSFGSTLDGKSLLIGISIGTGTFVTRNYVALPAARATKKVAKKTAHATVHVVTLGKR